MSKYPRTYHLPYSKGATNDDKISKDVNYLLCKEIVITEKLDGSNSCIKKDGVYGRSHAVFTTNPWDVELKKLHSIIGNYLDDETYVFGESLYAVHSIEYTNLESYFYIFGVRDNNKWVSWNEVEEYSYLLDIPTVPVLFKGVVNTEKELQEIVENLVTKESTLGGVREGIVVRNAGEFDNSDFGSNVMKWVRPNHVQTIDKHWTRNWVKAKISKNND